MPKEVFKEKLLSLIHKFDKDKHHYLSKGYLEAEVRQDFLDPLFEALGWDIGNKKKLSPPFDREVVVEKGETTGRPDYNFRIDGATKFFVEAKSPSVPLDNVNHILQAKYYAWSTKEVFFVILQIGTHTFNIHFGRVTLHYLFATKSGSVSLIPSSTAS